MLRVGWAYRIVSFRAKVSIQIVADPGEPADWLQLTGLWVFILSTNG